VGFGEILGLVESLLKSLPIVWFVFADDDGIWSMLADVVGQS
jgi:hypothetical protein